jgi:hypothetical protein
MIAFSSFVGEVALAILVILAVCPCIACGEELFNSTHYYMRGGQSTNANVSELNGLRKYFVRSVLYNSTISSISCLDETTAYAVEVDGTVYRFTGGLWMYEHSLGYIGASSISACAEDNVYIVGGNGSIDYYDGKKWDVIPWDDEIFLRGSDCSPDEGSAYLVGEDVVLRLLKGEIKKVWRFDNAKFLAVQALENGKVVAVGSGGAFWVYNGTAWLDRSQPGLRRFRSVWAEDHNQVFLVDSCGGFFKHQNGIWKQRERIHECVVVYVWGTSHNDLYLCGLNGCVVHYDGTSFKKINTGTSVFLRCIAGANPSSIYFAGGQSSIFKYNGSSFRRISIETPFKIDK